MPVDLLAEQDNQNNHNNQPNDLLSEGAQPSSSSDSNNMLGAMGIGGLGAAAFGAKKGWDFIAPLRDKLGGNFINQLIRPRHREYMVGKNPGQGVAKEGLFSFSLEGLKGKVTDRLNDLNTYAKGIRSLEENKLKTADFTKVLDPFYEALDEFSKAPKTHSAKINEIYDMVKDLEGNFPKGIKINEMPVETAYQIKDVVGKMQKWTVDNPSDHIMNKALRQVYHNIDSSIDAVLPLKEINSRMANLISAKQAIINQIELARNKDPLMTHSLLNMALSPLRTPAVKTGLAKILSEKFGMVKRMTGIIGLYPIISQAMQYKKDPAAVLASAMGLELAPQGSEERDIQTGELI